MQAQVLHTQASNAWNITKCVCVHTGSCKCSQMIMSNNVWHYRRTICSATRQMVMNLYGGLQWLMKCSKTTWNTWEKLKTYNGSTPLPILKNWGHKRLWVKDAGNQEPWHHHQCTMLLWNPPRPSYIIRIHCPDAWEHPFSHDLHCLQWRFHVLQDIWHPLVQPADVLKLLGQDGLKLVTQLIDSIYETGEWLMDFI